MLRHCGRPGLRPGSVPSAVIVGSAAPVASSRNRGEGLGLCWLDLVRCGCLTAGCDGVAFRTTRGAGYIHGKCRPRGVTDTSALLVGPSAVARKTETVLGRQFHGCDGGRSIPLKRTTGRVVFDGPLTERAFRRQPAPAIRDGCPPVARFRPIARQSHARSAKLSGVQPQQAAPRRANRPVRKLGQETNDDSGSYWEEH